MIVVCLNVCLNVYFIYGEHLLRNGVRHSENRRDDLGPSHLSKTY